MNFEVFLPVTNAHGTPFDSSLYRTAFDELADEFSLIDTWPIYRPVRATADEIIEHEFYRYRLDMPHTEDNLRWLIRWRELQEHRFGMPIWMIRYR